MTDWARGGPTWSINRFVAREVREQMRDNPLARRARYRWPLRLLRRLFSVRGYRGFLALYLLVDLTAVALEAGWQRLAPAAYPSWASGSGANDLLRDVPGFLIGAQVSLVGVHQFYVWPGAAGRPDSFTRSDIHAGNMGES